MSSRASNALVGHTLSRQMEDARPYIREINYAVGHGAIAGRNAMVIDLTDGPRSAEERLRIQQMIHQHRAHSRRTGPSDGVVVNIARGPGAIAGSNATIIRCASSSSPRHQ